MPFSSILNTYSKATEITFVLLHVEFNMRSFKCRSLVFYKEIVPFLTSDEHFDLAFKLEWSDEISPYLWVTYQLKE